MRKKDFIVVDNTEKVLLQVFNDLRTHNYCYFPYKRENAEVWRKTASKISRRAEDLINQQDPLLFPPTTSRWRNFGMVVLPKNVEIKWVQGDKKTYFYFDKKIF